MSLVQRVSPVIDYKLWSVESKIDLDVIEGIAALAHQNFLFDPPAAVYKLFLHWQLKHFSFQHF